MTGNSPGLGAPVGPRFAVAGDRVFDARAGGWADGTVVLVDDGVIVGVSQSAPDGWRVLEVPGASLLPGLIDAHTHVRPPRCRQGGSRARTADAGRGPAIRSTGRYPGSGERHSLTFPVGIDSCTGPDACRETVPTQIAYGIDCLKIYVNERFESPAGEDDYPDGPLVWTEEELAALVDEAHRQSLRVAAHSMTLSGARMAVAAGVDSIEHGFAISPDLAADMAARGTALVPTLLVTREHAAHGSTISEPLRAAHNRSFVNCLQAGVRMSSAPTSAASSGPGCGRRRSSP